MDDWRAFHAARPFGEAARDRRHAHGLQITMAPHIKKGQEPEPWMWQPFSKPRAKESSEDALRELLKGGNTR